MHINYKLKYLGVILILISGYFFLSYYSGSLEGYSFCLFKSLTGVPCPACGSIRSTVQLLQGNILYSVQINPFGILTNTLIFTSIFWMIRDILTNKETFILFLRKDWSNNSKIFLLLILLINWIWNIEKGL